MTDVTRAARHQRHLARVKLTPQQRALLSRRENAALRLGELVNERPRAKRVSRWFSEAVASRFISFVSTPRVTILGAGNLRSLPPDRGVLLAANHRSFFDMFMVLTHLREHLPFCERYFFPVRSAFWYETATGVLLNTVAAGMAMYPPIFREPERRDITRLGLDFLAKALREPGTVVGIHPEGTRGKSPNPHELLPAEAGFGRVVLAARPLVVPVFINGLTNDFVAECRSTFRGDGAPIIIVVGEPLDMRLRAPEDPQRLRAQIAVGREVLAKIGTLARVDAAMRGMPLAAQATNAPS